MISVLSFVNSKFAARENRCSLFQFQRIVRPWLATSFILPRHFFGIPRLRRPEPRLKSKFGLRFSQIAEPCGPACGSRPPRRPSASVQSSAYPKSPRSGRYFDLRLPSGAAPSGPTFGCSYYRLPSPPVRDRSIPDGTPCRPPATKQSDLST